MTHTNIMALYWNFSNQFRQTLQASQTFTLYNINIERSIHKLNTMTRSLLIEFIRIIILNQTDLKPCFHLYKFKVIQLN